MIFQLILQTANILPQLQHLKMNENIKNVCVFVCLYKF